MYKFVVGYDREWAVIKVYDVTNDKKHWRTNEEMEEWTSFQPLNGATDKNLQIRPSETFYFDQIWNYFENMAKDNFVVKKSNPDFFLTI